MHGFHTNLGLNACDKGEQKRKKKIRGREEKIKFISKLFQSSGSVERRGAGALVSIAMCNYHQGEPGLK